MSQASELHQDLSDLYDAWLAGRHRIGYIGPEGFRGKRGSYDPDADRANALISRKNHIRNKLVDDINKGNNIDWKQVNTTYSEICTQLKVMDAIIYSAN